MSSFVFYCNKESYKHIWRSMKQYRYCKILQFKHFKNMDLKNLSLHLNTTSCFLKTNSSLIPPQLRFSDWNVLRLKCSEKTPQTGSTYQVLLRSTVSMAVTRDAESQHPPSSSIPKRTSRLGFSCDQPYSRPLNVWIQLVVWYLLSNITWQTSMRKRQSIQISFIEALPSFDKSYKMPLKTLSNVI